MKMIRLQNIVEKLQFAIEQHPSFLKVEAVEEYTKEEEALNKQRKFWDMY